MKRRYSAFGLARRAAAPEALRCQALRLLPYERAIYEQAAALIWDALAIESSVVEPASPEICFAEVDDRHVVPRIRAFSRELAAAAQTPIQVGLASSKITARYAALRAEVGEPVLVYPGCESSLLADVDIESLELIDAEMMRRLEKLSIRTLGDVQMISYRNLHRAVGRMAVRLSRLAIGLDGDPVLPAWPRPCLTIVQSFEYEVTNLEPVHDGVRRCAQRLAHALRMRREHACLLTLSLIREDRSCSQLEERLPGPIQSSDGLYSAAARLLHRMQAGSGSGTGAGIEIGQEQQAITAVSLHAADLTIASGMQLELMDMHGNHLPADTRRRIEVTLEYLRSRFGIGSVLTAATLQKARRIDFWISPFCRQMNEIVDVIEGQDGRPIQFWRRQQRHHICAILNDWCETSWVWNELVRMTVFRVETDTGGLYELRRLGPTWRLTAAED